MREVTWSSEEYESMSEEERPRLSAANEGVAKSNDRTKGKRNIEKQNNLKSRIVEEIKG